MGEVDDVVNSKNNTEKWINLMVGLIKDDLFQRSEEMFEVYGYFFNKL